MQYQWSQSGLSTGSSGGYDDKDSKGSDSKRGGSEDNSGGFGFDDASPFIGGNSPNDGFAAYVL